MFSNIISRPCGRLRTAGLGQGNRLRMKGSIVLLLVANLACRESPPSPPDQLALVAGKPIDAAELRASLDEARSRGAMSEQLEALTTGGRRNALDSLVDEFLFAAAARRDGLDLDEHVERDVQRLVRRHLASEYIRWSLGKQDFSDGKLRAYYESHAEVFMRPKRVLARHVVVSERALAEDLRDKVLAGADFAELARNHNIDATARRGGDLGWLAPGTMVSEFEDVLFALDPSETSPVLETRFGFHVIQVKQVQNPVLPAYTKVKQAVRRSLEQKIVEELRGKAKASLGVQYAADIEMRLERSK